MSQYNEYVKQHPDMPTAELAALILAQEEVTVKESTIKRGIRRARVKIKGNGRKGDSYEYNGSEYVFSFNNPGEDEPYIWDMPRQEVGAICRWYPDPHGLNKEQLCTRLRNHFDRDITPDFLDRVLKCLGLTKNSNPLAPHVLDEWTEVQISDHYLQIKREKAELKNMDNEADQYKKLYEEQVAKDQTVAKFVKKIAKKINKNDIPDFKKRNVDETLEPTSIVMILSDWHVGKDVKLPTNKFNKDVFMERIANLVYEIEQHFVSNTRPVDECHILILGDLLDGVAGNMHNAQWVGQDLHFTDQVVWAAKALAYVLDAVSELLGVKITVHSVAGNHGRVSSNRKEDEIRFAEQMLYVLADEMSTSNLEWDRCEDVVGEFLVGDTKILFTHGERIGKEKDLAWVHRAGANHFVVCTGHLHSPRWESVDNDVYLARGGSVCGTDEFATRYGHGCRPAQVLFEVRPAGPRSFIELPL